MRAGSSWIGIALTFFQSLVLVCGCGASTSRRQAQVVGSDKSERETSSSTLTLLQVDSIELIRRGLPGASVSAAWQSWWPDPESIALGDPMEPGSGWLTADSLSEVDLEIGIKVLGQLGEVKLLSRTRMLAAWPTAMSLCEGEGSPILVEAVPMAASGFEPPPGIGPVGVRLKITGRWLPDREPHRAELVMEVRQTSLGFDPSNAPVALNGPNFTTRHESRRLQIDSNHSYWVMMPNGYDGGGYRILVLRFEVGRAQSVPGVMARTHAS